MLLQQHYEDHRNVEVMPVLPWRLQQAAQQLWPHAEAGQILAHLTELTPVQVCFVPWHSSLKLAVLFLLFYSVTRKRKNISSRSVQALHRGPVSQVLTSALLQLLSLT